MPAGKDNYGRTLQDIGEKNFIPFRFHGQYEDEEIGLYYNRFRYYDPETGQYTQQDPIGLAGGNPTLYGYVYNTLGEIDPFGLKSWSEILRELNIPMPKGLFNPHGHHIVFKGDFVNDIRGIPVRASQQILARFNIDINDPANLMWASNTSGVHTFENATKIFSRLEKMEAKLMAELDQGIITPEMAQARMKQELQSAGHDVFSCY